MNRFQTFADIRDAMNERGAAAVLHELFDELLYCRKKIAALGELDSIWPVVEKETSRLCSLHATQESAQKMVGDREDIVYVPFHVHGREAKG